jgi:hypothetical protein
MLDQLRPIVIIVSLVKPSDILHTGQLIENEATRKDVRFENVVLGMS